MTPKLLKPFKSRNNNFTEQHDSSCNCYPQSIAAQQFREQQEHERRRHLEELRHRDEDKRTLVEERRKAIESAEQERLEALIKKNQVLLETQH